MVSALQPLLDSVLDGRTKGYPQTRPPMSLGAVARQGWSLFQGDLSTPVALLKGTALDANSRWMREFLQRTGTSLCPHGKTSMAPQLFHRQLADGAWGITVATPRQAQVARDFGVDRVLLANQLVDEGHIAWVQRALDEDPGFDFTCVVDTVEGVRELERAAGGGRKIQVLLETGVRGGRTGARDLEHALAVGRAVRGSRRLALRGVECFEGIIGSARADEDQRRVEAWLDQTAEVAARCSAEGLFDADEILLSAGGSAYFDLVASRLSKIVLDRPTRVLLRSGCYLFHDVSHYAGLFSRVEARLADSSRPRGSLRPAIEIWGRVLSRPEPSLAFLDFGKRDVGHDLGLPVPVAWARARHDRRPRASPEGWSIELLNDQHAKMTLATPSELAVGDLVGCGISHPCTTLDRWQLLYVVDDAYQVTEAIRTFF